MEKMTKVTRKYQITIPKEVRKKVHVDVGDRLEVTEKDEMIILKKVGKKRSLTDFAGCWKGYPENPDEFMKNLRKMWSTWKA